LGKEKSAQLDRERGKFLEEGIIEEKQVTAAVKKGLQNKVDKHNEKHGDKAGKKSYFKNANCCI